MNKGTIEKKLGKLRIQTHKTINDTYIWATIAASALEQSLLDTEFKKRQFPVPSRKAKKQVSRRPEQIMKFLEDAMHRDLFASIFVFLAAQVEAFLASVCRLVLISDPRRLKTRVKGIEHIQKVETSEIIDAASRDDLIKRLIEREMVAIFYARPAAYFLYMEKVIGVALQEDLKTDWIEIKATRDIIVHNSSVVNDTYIEKAGAKARASLGAVIPFDKDYFERSIAIMKALVGKSEVSVRKSLR